MAVIYSPSQTQEWLACPVKRALRYRDGWRPRQYGKRELAALLGTGVAAGVALYHRELMRLPWQALHIGQAIQNQLFAWRDAGFVCAEWDLAQQTALVERIERGIRKYREAAPIPSMWEILAVEHTIPDSGNARLDLAACSNEGLIVADLKVKLTLDSRYRQKELNRYRNSWQLYHYAYFYGRERQEPVRHYYIILVVLEPRFSVELIPYDVDPEGMALWQQSAVRVWRQMEKEDSGEEQPWIAAKHADEYGDCEYWKACFECYYEPRLMAVEYIQRKEQ